MLLATLCCPADAKHQQSHLNQLSLIYDNENLASMLLFLFPFFFNILFFCFS